MPVARFQMPDGRIGRFEVPEGTSPEQATKLIGEHLAAQAPEESPSLPSRVLRQVGLTARAGVQGLGDVFALPGTIYDAAADAVGAGGLRFKSSEAVSKGLTAAGLPEAQNPTERISQDVAGAMTGQGGLIRLASAAAPSSALGTRLAELFRSNPGSQVVGSAGGSGASSGAREEGLSPVVQNLAGIAGGVAAPIATTSAIALPATVRGSVAAVAPFTGAGREQIVGSTLRRLSTDPKKAMANLTTAGEEVAGSKPTTAQAARDEGLLITERGVGSAVPRAGAQLARRASEQNQARTAILDELAQDEAALKAAKASRESTAGPLYKEAREQGVNPEAAQVLKPQITNLMERLPTGVMEKAKELARINGETMGKDGSVEGMHWMKIAVDDMLSSGKQTGIGKQTERALMQFKGDLLTVMDELSPAYAKARQTYRGMSGDVNRMEVMQDFRSRVQNTGTDAATGERLLSAAKFGNVLRNPEARARLKEVLTPDQFKSVESISADLDRAALSASSGKAAGSNTLQNISTAFVIGRALGNEAATSGVAHNMARPLSWLNKLNEHQIQDLLTDAMLDPTLARRLMESANPKSVGNVSSALRANAIKSGWGGQIGALVGTFEDEVTPRASRRP